MFLNVVAMEANVPKDPGPEIPLFQVWLCKILIKNYDILIQTLATKIKTTWSGEIVHVRDCTQ